MPSFQCRELLAKSKVFKKQRASGVEQAKDRAKQESENVCHAVLLQRLACETQCSILLKSRADRILARHNRAKSSIFVPQLNRLFVADSGKGKPDAKLALQIFEVQ